MNTNRRKPMQEDLDLHPLNKNKTYAKTADKYYKSSLTTVLKA